MIRRHSHLIATAPRRAHENRSCEYELDRPSRLGAVVANGGWSGWSTQDVPQSLRAIQLRVRRTGADYLVEAAPASASVRVSAITATPAAAIRCLLVRGVGTVR